MDVEDQEKLPFIDERENGVLESNSSMKKDEVLLEMDTKNENLPSGRCFQDASLFPLQKLDSSSVNNQSDSVDYPIKEARPASKRFASFKDKSKPNPSPDPLEFPLHAAAEKGNVKAFEKLLVEGDPLEMDLNLRTPLHYACGFPYQKKALKMLDLLLKCPQAQDTEDDNEIKIRFINSQDNRGETGLHIAARTGHRKVVERLLFSAADVNLKDKNGWEPLQLIYSKVPTALLPVLDGAVECKVGDANDQNLIVRLDFGSIVGYPAPEKVATVFELETKLLSYCLQQSEQKRSAILLHPLVQTFLFLKWKKIRILLWISILYHVIWLLLYTLFICDLYLIRCPCKISGVDEGLEMVASNNHTGEHEPTNDTEQNDSFITECDIGAHLLSSLNIELGFLFYISISVMLKELYEIYSTPQTLYYFLQLENVGQWLLIGVVFLTSFPIFLKEANKFVVIHAWQYQAAALGIFLAWSLILSQIGKIPRFGIYIEILAKVLRSFTMFMITFASLLVAFMVSFQILMPEKGEFEHIPWGFIKVLVMMIGEINYDEVFFEEENNPEIPFPASTKLLYAAFICVICIILFNLLIGLVVSDIQGLQSVAQLSSLSSQLEQIYLMEKFIISKRLQGWLQRIHKNHWLRFFLVTQQTEDEESYMGVDIHISKIPRELQHLVREVAAPNAIQETDDEDESDKKSVRSENTQGSMKTFVRSQELREEIKSILKELLEEMKETRAANAPTTSV